jgi:hypothetical protein
MGNWVSRLTNKSITTTLEIHHLCTKNATEQIIQNILLPIRELMFGINNLPTAQYKKIQFDGTFKKTIKKYFLHLITSS